MLDLLIQVIGVIVASLFTRAVLYPTKERILKDNCEQELQRWKKLAQQRAKLVAKYKQENKQLKRNQLPS